jgi:hypothetical protein
LMKIKAVNRTGSWESISAGHDTFVEILALAEGQCGEWFALCEVTGNSRLIMIQVNRLEKV